VVADPELTQISGYFRVSGLPTKTCSERLEFLSMPCVTEGSLP